MAELDERKVIASVMHGMPTPAKLKGDMLGFISYQKLKVGFFLKKNIYCK